MTDIYYRIFCVVTGAGAAHAETFDAVTDVLLTYYKSLLVPVGITLAVIMIVYAGIVYASSQGQPDKLNLAKELIIGALTGLFILLSAGWIVTQIVG